MHALLQFCGLARSRVTHKQQEGAQRAGQPQPHPVSEGKPSLCLCANIKAAAQESVPLPARTQRAELSLQPCTAEHESSKLFHLDNSSDLQQRKSSVKQLKARLH